MTKKEKFFYKNMGYLVFTSMFVIISSLVEFTFLGYVFTMAIFVFPFTLYFSNILTKNVDDRNVIISLLVAFLAQLFTFVAISSFTPAIVDVGYLFGALAGFVLAHLINLLFYYNLAKPRRGRRVKWLELAFVYYTAITVNVLAEHIFFNAGNFTPRSFYKMLLAIGLQAIVTTIPIILDKNRKKEVR